MNISLEIVPRSHEELIAAAKEAAEYSHINALNIPDQLSRFPIRSWEACQTIAKLRDTRIIFPHLRAMDFNPAQPFPHIELFRTLGIQHVLVITGDKPKNSNQPFWDTNAVAFIEKLKREMPELKVFAAFDPYRNNIRYELDYVHQKEDAGADGFMSQPFFDLRLLEIYAEYLEGRNVYWGVSPVVTESSRNYWESRNRAIFPKQFTPSLEWNIQFGREVHQFCRKNNFDFYLMPIKVDICAYLNGLFAGS